MSLPTRTPPQTPSYMRSTASSSSRKTPNPTTPPTTPTKKPKRPSSLTGHDRQIALLLGLQTSMSIKPAKPNLPHGFSTLPAEIRLQIYEQVIHTSTTLPISIDGDPKTRHPWLWPALLRVSRLIRHEFAYIFYTQGHFTFTMRSHLCFAGLQGWVNRLPPNHRLFLTRNPNLHIDLKVPAMRHFWWDTPAEIIDQDAWKECRPYGNMYAVAGCQHQEHFLSFCRLANWWLWCAKPIHNGIRWNYRFSKKVHYRPVEGMVGLLKEGIGSFALPCVRKEEKTSGKQKALMKKEALNILGDVDRAFGSYVPPRHHDAYAIITGDRRKEWEDKFAELVGVLEKW
ncbi:hypothetical protein P154DRAFT_526800 [Amniculicola lignicola CBS 123094]|uniref:2EXR domain-containing protein n=1 Tax=Amniculicola lignicola CBS 123094 TaxID=1392246 RepID=A0A6A5VZB5_9PLEO|nr:hypothetical protein P154DRAFT_526800 [Amniculicola lignicola CBS 123094]